MIRIEATYREYPDLPETITLEIDPPQPVTIGDLVELVGAFAVVARRANAETGVQP